MISVYCSNSIAPLIGSLITSFTIKANAIPVRPRNFILRFIHTIWSFFKDKGYYTLKDNGEYEKVRIDELIFDCIKFENDKMVEPK